MQESRGSFADEKHGAVHKEMIEETTHEAAERGHAATDRLDNPVLLLSNLLLTGAVADMASLWYNSTPRLKPNFDGRLTCAPYQLSLFSTYSALSIGQTLVRSSPHLPEIHHRLTIYDRQCQARRSGKRPSSREI